ncbi:hypothetical protein DHX103_14365 [Planococcus sp. X10-3]|uniref:hypothetical protein n=1 Tax=Planococcus sp. X10-3 TaxID=3061240 RepID=UPI003BB1BC37
MTTEIKELSVGRYEFFKEKGRSDESIGKQYGMTISQLTKWKGENNLVGKDYGLRGRKAATIKTVSIQDEEVAPLREKNLSEERLADSYNPNKHIQEKLAEKKPAAGWERVKELTKEMSEEMKTEILANYDKAVETDKSTSIEETQMNVGKSETFDKAFSEAIESDMEISYKEQLENLQKEKAVMEEKHIQRMAEMDKALYEAQKHSKYRELMHKVSNAVTAERHRQNGLYGHQRHDSGKWLAILAEEFGEVAQAMQRGEGWGKESDADDLFKELTHVSAVANAWAEQVLEGK